MASSSQNPLLKERYNNYPLKVKVGVNLGEKNAPAIGGYPGIIGNCFTGNIFRPLHPIRPVCQGFVQHENQACIAKMRGKSDKR